MFRECGELESPGPPTVGVCIRLCSVPIPKSVFACTELKENEITIKIVTNSRCNRSINGWLVILLVAQLLQHSLLSSPVVSE